MGLSNDTDNDPLHDDEHLYSRRASAHTLYSTTASSGRSSPTFSRRGSLTTLPPLHTTGSLPRTRTHTLLRGVSDNGYDVDESATSYRIPSTRATHPAAIPSGPLNFDGIIKQPSRYPYARSHHHHPYAHYSHSHDGGSPPPGHPYYSQKRHSFAALRTTPSRSSLSSNSHNMAAMTASNIGIVGNGVEPSLPLVRLPSIDQGLPPFPGDSSGMILPIRRGSLTDPLLHAHNPSPSSNALPGSSGTSPFPLGGLSGQSSLSPVSASAYKLNSYPLSSSYDNPTRRANDNENNTYSYPSPASVNTPSAPTKDGLPIFGKTSKTLFPQQHGSSLSLAPTGSNGNELPQAGTSATSVVTAHPAGSGTASMLGTKRKLEPLSEAEFGDGTSGADYFTPEAPVMGSTVQPSGPVSTSSSLSNLTAKRRASQTFINTANISRGEQQGQLPTPASLNSAGSASASSSERRSSNDSSEAGLPGANMVTGKTTTGSAGGPSYTTSMLPMSIQEEDAHQATSRYSNITPRQHGNHAHPREVEADTKAGYAFPMSRPSVDGEVSVDTRMSPSTQMSGVPRQASTSAAYYESQPSYSDRGYSPLPPSSSATLHHVPPYAGSPGSTMQNRIPPQGSALPPDLRSKATTVFGGTGGVRPSYTSNGVPVGVSSGTSGKIDNLKLPPHGAGGQLHHSGQPMYNGPSTSTKAGFAPGPSALSAHQQQQMTTSSLPYARSPALKVSHKIAERKRRKEMKELFDELRDCIPSMNVSGAAATTPTVIDGIPISTPAPPQPHPADVGGRGIKSSKWEVLAKAVEYINKLQYENSELSNTVLELQRLNQAFQDELSLVKNGANLGDGGLGSSGTGMNGDGSVPYHQDPQLYPHQQPHPQAALASYNEQQQPSAHPSPSPASVHSMPPLTHHSHSMPAAIGGGTHSSLHSPHPSMHQSPLVTSTSATPVVYPISAPPHMASHSFFSPNDASSLNGNNTAQAFANPNQRHFALHNHSRNVSMGSNHGSVNGGNATGQGHFEHAGSAPPALQQHPHQQHQPHHLQQQHNGMGSSNHSTSSVHPQAAVQIFSYHPSPSYGSDVQLPQQDGYAAHQHPRQLQRPGSIRSHHSNQSIMSGMSAGGHSHPSQSPVSQHIQVQQQQQQQEAWGSSSPYSQQAPLVRNGTQPPGSAQGTPMISPLNATY